MARTPLSLPDFPWDRLKDARLRASAHPGGIVDLSVGTPVDPVPGVVPESLPARDQAYFDRWTGSWPWVHMLNTVEALEGLYNMAIGAGSLPKDGAGIAHEIASIENIMKYERNKYMADPQLQARYRTLLDMKR